MNIIDCLASITTNSPLIRRTGAVSRFVTYCVFQGFATKLYRIWNDALRLSEQRFGMNFVSVSIHRIKQVKERNF